MWEHIAALHANAQGAALPPPPVFDTAGAWTLSTPTSGLTLIAQRPKGREWGARALCSLFVSLPGGWVDGWMQWTGRGACGDG